MFPKFPPHPTLVSSEGVASLHFDYDDAGSLVPEALALLISKYTGETEFSLAQWDPERRALSALPVAIEKGSQLSQIVSAADCSCVAQAPIVLIRAPALPEEMGEFDLAFCLPEESSKGGGGILYYRRSLFHEITAKALVRHLQKIFSYPSNTLLSEVELLDEEERRQAIQAAGDPSVTLYEPRPTEQFHFSALFEEQCRRTPHKRALWCQGEEWTYQRLHAFVQRVASLIHASVEMTKGAKVGVCLERRPEFLGVLLGILKAGGAYVPLEPDLPQSRRDFISENAKVCLTIDEDWLTKLASAPLPETPPEVTMTGQDPAYVIYTSGSTGEPKGVEVQHHALCDFSLVMREHFQLSENHTWLAITTIAFDACIMELFPLLLSGGTVALAPPKLGADGENLSKLLQETGATHLWATPTTLRILTGSGWKGDPNLTIFTGGEAVDRDIAEIVLPLCKDLINGYGPTETTVFATTHPIASGEGQVPLGSAMPHMTMYLLDDEGHPLPPMARGHYWIGGQGVTLGYLGRSDLTAERFVPDPFATAPGARMYQSGDVGYRDEEGVLYYLGRSDYQVKLRGYRIELGEIEARLANHPQIKDAAVLVREDRPGEQRLVAYYVLQEGAELSEEELQDFLGGQLPDYMVPAWFVRMESFPTTAGLKLDRKALPEPVEKPKAVTAGEESLAQSIASLWARLLGRPYLEPDTEVFRMGANSLNAVRFQKLLADELGYEVTTAQIFQHRSPAALEAFLRKGRERSKAKTITDPGSPIAIVGMSGRFPGAPNLEAYWDLIVSRREAVQTFSEDELREAGISPSEFHHPDYVPRGTVLERALDFDPAFFGVNRRDAAVLSPQFRLFLTTAWEALEQAGYPEEPADSSIGIFAGAGDPAHLRPTRDYPEQERLQILVGNSADFLATRSAFALGLTGPAVSVQTACSTSLVAIAEACFALRSGRCSMALAGGASFSWPHAQGYLAGEGLMFSRGGHCRPFDHQADGTIFSQGVGVVLLKPLQQALKDGDTIHATISGVATNNDGARKANYAAPSIEGQADVIRMALDDAGLSAREVGYVEAHGTGTIIGDPIEVAGLTSAYREDTTDSAYCGIGSVKGNIGHADAAAGVAGLLKAVLALKHKTLPPTLNFEKANPEIDFAQTPFQVQIEAKNWECSPNQSLRVAAVSALGMGGTNAHAILQEAPEEQAPREGTTEKNEISSDWFLLPLSSPSAEGVSELVSRFEGLDLPDRAAAAHTLLTGRKMLAHRAFAIAPSQGKIGSFVQGMQCDTTRQPVFLFTGQGAQFLRMGEALLRGEPVFRKAMAECDRLLEGGLAWLYPNEGESEADINQTKLTQPALFSVMWSQAQLWQSWGIRPTAMSGHSIGEFVAATLAGVFSLQDALKLVSRRGELMQKMEPGTMMAVFADDERVAQLLSDFPGLDLCTVNAPELSVVGGRDEVVDEALAKLEKEEIRCRKIRTSHAFHSRSMEPILEEFTQLVASVTRHRPQIPYTSNVSGGWITEEQATSPQYYARQLRETVRYSDNVQTLIEETPPRLFLEMGPGATLASLTSRQLGGTSHLALPTLADAKEKNPLAFTREALGRAWGNGLQLPMPASAGRRISLPGTVLNEETFDKPKQEQEGEDEQPAPIFHLPSWKQEPLLSPQAEHTDSPWLLFVRPIQHRLIDLRGLAVFTEKAILVQAGESFQRHDARSYTIRMGEPEDYVLLLKSVDAELGEIAGILHTWSLSPEGQNWEEWQDEKDFRESLASSAASLTWLGKALSQLALRKPLPLTVLTNGIFGSRISPSNYTLPAVASVLQKELPAVVTKVLETSWNRPPQLADVVSEVKHYPFLAYKDGHWWSKTYSAVPLEEAEERPQLKSGDALIVTGGLGGLALATCVGLAEEHPGLEFILLARNTELRSDYQRAMLNKLKDLECTVHLCQVDLNDPEAIVQAVTELQDWVQPESFAGVLHTAGILDDGAIASKEQESFWRVFTVKAFGAQMLTKQLLSVGLSPRFQIYFSSIASDLGLFGQVDYSAANAYLDGLAQRLHQDDVPSFAINWPAFHSVGMAARTAVAQANGQAGSRDAFGVSLAEQLATNALEPAQAPQAILAILGASKYPRVAVSKLSFRDQMEAAVEDGRATSLVAGDGAAALLADTDPMELMLKVWQEQLANPELKEDDDYFELGGDSLAAVGLTGAVERAFGCPVPISYLMDSPTVSRLTSKLGLKKGATAVDESALPPFLHRLVEGEEGKPALVLIHGADGGILFFRLFANLLETGHPIYAFEAPMLHDLDASAPDRLEEVASTYLSVIQEFVPGPVILGGYSMGGIIAYDIAQKLSALGQPPVNLLLFDTPNPAAPITYHSPVERIRRYLARYEDKNASDKVMLLSKRFLTGSQERIKLKLEKILSSSDKVGEQEHWRHIQCREQHAPLEDRYQPEFYPHQLSVLMTNHVYDKFSYAPDMGWTALAQDLRIAGIVGPHLEIFNQPYLETLLTQTRALLAE